MTVQGQPLRMSPFDLAQDGKPGWVQRNSSQSEFVQRRECDVEDDQLRAAREWLAHVEAGRIGKFAKWTSVRLSRVAGNRFRSSRVLY